MAKGAIFKRLFDFSLALVGSFLLLPLWIIFSLLIFLEDRGTLFFFQQRCGKDGKPFRVIKFRTMRLPREGEDWPVLDLEKDPRLTRVGNLLRATALDELPQLLNILKGDMSFVGPRPLPLKMEDGERSYYEKIEEVPGYQLRTRVRPGLTGIAQIYAPKDVGRRSKFRYDNLYIKRMSFWLDLKLIFLSLWITLKGRWEHRGRKL